MPAAQRATIESTVHDDLQRWIIAATKYMDPGSLQFKLFERSINQLGKVDATAAALHRAFLHHCTGNIEESLHWIKNLRHLAPSQRDEADRLEALVLSNLWYFSRARAVLVGADLQTRPSVVNMLYLVAEWTRLVAWSKELPEDELPELQKAAMAASAFLTTIGHMGITEEQIRGVLDLAGEVARENHLFFIGEVPHVRALGDCMLYQLEVDTEPHVAAKMTDRVIDMMIENDLMLPGFAFAFLGCRRSEQQRAGQL